VPCAAWQHAAAAAMRFEEERKEKSSRKAGAQK